MEEKDVLELIDLYLTGKIQPGDLARLNDLRKTNPEIEHRIKESQEAFDVLKYLRYRQLREKLRQIDAADVNNGKGIHRQKWLLGAMFLFTLLIGFWMWAIRYFDPASIALRQFLQTSDTHIIELIKNDQDENNWVLAAGAFQERNFKEAISLFQLFVNNPGQEISTAAEWNILLARLADGGPDSPWEKDMIKFQSTASEPFKSEATRLLHIIHLPVYQVIILKLSPKLSSLKPRLM